MSEAITIWIGALVTLTVLSYLIRENTVYRLVQSAALGIAVAFTLVISWQQVLKPRWWDPIQASAQATFWPSALQSATAALPAAPTWHGMLWILAIIPGALWYFQLSKRWFWLSTIISGLFVGVAAGLAFKNQILLIMPQISASVKPLNPAALPGGLTADNVLAVVWNVVFLVLLFASLLYFFFSLKAGNPLMGRPLRLGRLAIMACLGSMFGGTVMTRVAYLLDRLMMLYNDWFVGQIREPVKRLIGL